jgi:hypothetical protein
MDSLKRVGVIVVVVVLIGVAKATVLKPGPDQQYFNKLAQLDRATSEKSFENPAALRAKVQALPIEGVTDPKLREYHDGFLELIDAVEKHDEAKVLAIGTKMEALIPDLNKRYK